MLVKQLVQKGNIEKLTNLTLNPNQMEKTNQILINSSFNNYNLDIKKQIQYFWYKKLGHGINHCKIKITKFNTNVMQFKITIKNNYDSRKWDGKYVAFRY
jgi:hypothetical protein